MRNKRKRKFINSHEEFKKNLEIYYEYFDINYPGWRDDKEIYRLINKTCKNIQKNKYRLKYRLIKKEQFKDNWPFYVDAVIVFQRNKVQISVFIESKEYALNGFCRQSTGLSFPHDAGKAKIGISIAPFIQIGLKL